MLGFVALSETAISESSTALASLAYLDSLPAILGLALDLPKAYSSIQSDSIIGTLSTTELDPTATANTDLNSVLVTSYINNSAVIAESIIEVAPVTVALNKGTLAITAFSLYNLDSVSSSLDNNLDLPQAKSNKIPNSITAAINLSSPVLEAQARKQVLPQILTLLRAIPSVTEDSFDYEAVTDLYSRDRLLYLNAINRDNVVHITDIPNTTVYVKDDKIGAATAYIKAT